MLLSHTRATTLAFHVFKHKAANGELEGMDYTVKYDGFHLIGVNAASGATCYFTKQDIPLDGCASKMLKAINKYLHELPDEERIDPMRIERIDLSKPARQVHFEFRCMRKEDSTGGAEWEEGAAESLQDLFQGKCLTADGDLDTENYVYPIKIFDALFTRKAPAFARIEAAMNYYGPDMTATQIFNFTDLVHFLNGCEGVVAHMGGSGKEKAFKIKVPCPIRAKIVGVQNTIGESFAGWDKILVCVERDAGDQRSCFIAVCEINLNEIFTDHTRPSKGKVYANPKCVKRSKGTVVYELANGGESTSAIAPMLNALYGLIGKADLDTPTASSTSTVARIQRGAMVLCGSNRTFNLTGYEYLSQPVDVIMGVNDIWPIANGQFHLQASSVLCLPGAGFGPAEFMDMPPTNGHTLWTAAERRLCRDRNQYYTLVGMKHGPFHDLPAMNNALFCAY
jgi:hypothetical protein